jgi:hypothetical protein
MDLAKLAGRHGMTYSQQLYRMSRDGGQIWEKAQAVVQKGEEYSESHYARGIWYGKNGGYICNDPIKLRNGSILLPFQVWPWDEKNNKLSTCKFSTVFIGTWAKDLSRIQWDYGDYIEGLPDRYGSLCEPTLAELKNGDVLTIMRASPVGASAKFYCISKDGGRTWSEPKRLTYDNGEQLLSPPAISRLYRSSRNGKLYWIGNIMPFREDLYVNMPYNLQRFVLQIAEVNEDNFSIRKETVTTIDESKAGEIPREYSNFYIYEDRHSGNMILTMCEACALPLKGSMVPGSYQGPYATKESFTAHSYRYEIKV